MSVVGKSIGAPLKVDAVQPIAVYDPATGLPAASGGGGGGTTDNPSVLAGEDGTGPASKFNPVPVVPVQGNLIWGPITLVANTAQTIIGAFPDRRGMKVLNWTSAPVYLSQGTTGTPPSGPGADVIPPVSSEGIPGQWIPPYAPVGGIRAVGAVAGGLTVIVW